MVSLVPRGELKRKAQQKNLLTNVLFLSEPSDMTDIHIITLKQHLYEKACEDAWKECVTPEDVETRANELLETKYTAAKEFVNITQDNIQVGVNTTKVDDFAVDKALLLLTQADNLTPGSYIEFEEMYINDSKHS